MNKQMLSERDICTKFITPALEKAGWDVLTQVTIKEFDREKVWWGGPQRKGRKTTEHAWKVSAKDLAARNYNLNCKKPYEVAVELGVSDQLMAEYQQITKQLADAQHALKTELLAALKSTSGGAV